MIASRGGGTGTDIDNALHGRMTLPCCAYGLPRRYLLTINDGGNETQPDPDGACEPHFIMVHKKTPQQCFQQALLFR